MSLTNKIAIVTGASRGIGRAIALQLAANGAKVAAVARNGADLAGLRNEIADQGGESLSVVANVAVADEARVVVEKTLERFGRVDILVNNAGVGQFKPTEEFEESEWDETMDVNVKGTFLLSKAVLPHLKAQRSGHLLSIASDVSKRTFGNGSVYCASKYAQDAFCAAVRKEVRPFGIKVSVIYPGLVATYFGGTQPDEERKKDWLQSADIAHAAVYILGAPAHVVVDELMLHPLSQEY